MACHGYDAAPWPGAAMRVLMSRPDGIYPGAAAALTSFAAPDLPPVPNAPSLLEHLRSHAPDDDAEAASLASVRDFLRTAAHPFARSTTSGHVTASAVILDADGSSALLVRHRKLGRWLQPGGHVEAGDASVFAAAVREAEEECGLAVRASAYGERILDVDAHAIAAWGAEAAHVHFDVRYLLVPSATGQPRPGPDARWFRPEELEPLALDAALHRALAKAQRVLRER